MSITLSSLGIRKKRIYEVVVSTYNQNGKPTAAPMGLRALDTKMFLIRPYVSTSVYRNLHDTQCGVVNITTSPGLFFRTTFKNEQRRLALPRRWFTCGKTVNAPRIKSAEGHIEFIVKHLDFENEDRARYTCKSSLIEARRSFPRPYCRSNFALIECIIHATRIKPFLSDGRRAEAEKLMDLVEYYKQLTDRVAPSSEDARMMSELSNLVGTWRKTSASPH